MNKSTAPTLELRDIHLPDAPSYWPLAPGWWILILLAIVLTYFIVKYLAKRRRKIQLNQLMQQQLQKIQNGYKQHKNKHKLSVDVSDLLKRFIRHIMHDSNATSLTGKAWIDYLNQQVEQPIFDKFTIALTEAQYAPNLDYDVPSLIATVKNYFPTAIKRLKNA